MKTIVLAALIAVLPLVAGCATPGRNTAAGALLGSALGAGAGAVVGNQSGHAGSGTAVGAGFGALAGALIGNALDGAEQATEEVDAKAGAALYEAEVSARSMSILDVIRMSQSGVSDGLIIAKIDQSRSRFDLSASDIIDLKRSGVSERVIEHLVRTGGPRYVASPAERPYERARYHRALPLDVRFGSGFYYCR